MGKNTLHHRVIKEENEKIIKQYEIDFLEWGKNLEQMENEIKTMKKLTTKQKVLEKKEEKNEKRVEKIEEKIEKLDEKKLVFENPRKEKDDTRHEINENRLEYMRLLKKNEKEKLKEFTNHGIDYYNVIFNGLF